MNRRKNGHPFAYSETLIISIAIIRAVCGLSYRMCEGLAQEALGKDCAPDFTTLGVVQTLNSKSTKSLKIKDRTPLNEQKT